MSEGEIQKAIMDYLVILGHFPIRINTMGVPKWNGKQFDGFRKSPNVGVADILCVMKGSGKLFAIEVKKPGGKVSDDQQAFLQRVADQGAYAMVAYSVDDVAESLEEVGLPNGR